MSSKLVVQVEPERLELRLRGVSALAAGTVYAPVVLEGAGGAVAPVLRLFRDETCADAVAWTSEPASPVPHHSRLMSFPSLRLDTEATLDWFSDARDAKTLPSSARVWGWLVAVDMGNGSDVGPVVLGASRVPVLLHDFSPVETEPGDSWSSVLAELVAEAIASTLVDATLGGRVSALEENTYTKAEVDAIVAALKRGSRQIVASLSDVASPQPLVIYMVAKSAAQTSNVYDEYIWIEVGGAGRWEKIGDTEIDLSGYVQKEAGKGLSTNDYTAADKTKLAGIAAGAQVNVIETVKVNGTALAPSGRAVDVPIPSTTETLAEEEYDSVSNSVTVDTPRQRDVKLKIRNLLSNTVNTLDTSASGTIATREWVQQEIDVPSPSDDDPAPNGTAWEGESDDYSRADHVHPTDTTRAAASEMSITTANDTATITLKQGTSVTVITQHQPLPAAVAPSTSAVQGAYADARDTGTALAGKQASITASGILKGNGSGTVSAAVAGTDYQAPLSAYTSTPSAPTASGSAGSSTAYSRGDHAHPAETLVVTGTLNLAYMTLTSLSHTFAEILAARQAGRNVLLKATVVTIAAAGAPGGWLLGWCSAEFGVVSGQSFRITQLWFSATMSSDLFDGSYHAYHCAVVLDYVDTAAVFLNQLADQGDLAGKLSTTGDTRTVTAEDSGGTETYKFAGTGETTDANAIVRVSGLPYVNVGEAAQMLAGVYGMLSRGVQRHTATSGETSATFGFADTPGTGKIADALLDIDNSGNTSALGMEFSGLGTTFVLAPPDGDDLAEMTSVDGGKQARFYFTETALVSNNLPVISIQRITLGAVATAITRGS